MRAKRGSVGALPAEARPAYRALDATLAAAGLFVVEAGELERFVPSVGHHGSRWAGEVLGRFGLTTAPALEAAGRFVRRVLS